MDQRKYIEKKLNVEGRNKKSRVEQITYKNQNYKKFTKYPYFNFDDVEYQDFISMLIKNLEPRFFYTN